MKGLAKNIYQEISAGNNVLLVGPTDSGKTWYAKNELMPFLSNQGKKVTYFQDLETVINLNEDVDFFIFDEFETLVDQDFLEAHSTAEAPYYSPEYLAKVKTWHDKLKKISTPSILILTRNNHGEISNIVENLKILDWGTKVKVFSFT